jgi:outer membrane lipoprotein-sorting protein
VYPLRGRRALAGFFLLVSFCLSSCLVRRRTITPTGKRDNRPLLKATKDELIARIRSISDPIQSFSMKVDMSPSIGNLYGGEITDYPTIAGYILFRRPDDIRFIGLDLVVHSTAIDMVSSGNSFRVWIPAKNQFIEGKNDAPAVSQNKLENLRPVAFLTSLLINPPDPGQVRTVLEDDTNETKAVYILMMIRTIGDDLRLVRNLYFDRHSLQISRQKTFDLNGYITSDTTYSNWKSYSGVQFPSLIDIQRPQDGYELLLTVTNLKFNTPEVTAEKFLLNQPPGAKVKVLQ